MALAALSVRLAHQLGLGSQLSGFWLQVISPQAGHRMAFAVFRSALRVYLGLPVLGGASLSTRTCPDCLRVVDPFSSHWLSMCPASRAWRVLGDTPPSIIQSAPLSARGGLFNDSRAIAYRLAPLSSQPRTSHVPSGLWDRWSSRHLCGCGNLLSHRSYLPGRLPGSSW